MSQFLQNLIGRHREGGVDKQVIAQVQPRPKSRFESASELTGLAQNDSVESESLLQSSQLKSDTGSSLTHGLSDSRPTSLNEINRPVLDTAVAKQQDKENPNRPTDSSHQFNNLNERIERLKIQLGRQSPILETPDRASSNLNNQVTKDHSGTDYPKLITQSDYKIAEIDNSQTNGSQQGADSISATILNLQQPDTKKKQQTTESSIPQRPSHQTGLLQTPDWLSEMQTDLNKQLQQLQAQSNPEPVVNVTIGRVEVKAVHPEASKQPKAHNKPSGVMSLDDYLKQRESRGRA